MRASRVLIGAVVATGLLFAASGPLPSATTRLRVGSLADSTLAPDAISRLQSRLDSGTTTLQHDSTLGYLPALLRALNIPASSQSLVFSRTSLQSDLIGPWSPRALYFNDDVYIGFVHGSDFLEIATVNPKTGVAFYTLDQETRVRPSFVHETQNCLLCHQSRASGNLPGFLMLSTVSDRLGYPISSVHSGSTTDSTPISQRFGGWYVTGGMEKAVHAGNVHSSRDFNQVDKSVYRNQIDLTVESHRSDLRGKFDSTPYLTRHSDIVALTVLVHQTSVHNLMNNVREAARVALLEQFVLDQYASDSVKRMPVATSNLRLRNAIEVLVRAMLFTDEAPLGGAMHGTTSFAEDFPREGPRDSRGRSLRDFDLEHRLFKYPLSFLIYSEGFDALPQAARDGVYMRLHSILGGEDKGPAFAQLTAGDRTAISEILIATKPEYAKRIGVAKPIDHGMPSAHTAR